MALNCNKEIPGVTDYEGTIGVPAGQCYHCHTGRCPVGITTQDPELRKRLHVEEAADRVYNFLHTLTLEVQMLARACGKTNVHSLEPEDLGGADHRGRGDGARAAGRHRLHPGRDRGARARADRDAARPLPREPGRRAARPRAAPGRSADERARATREPEKIVSIDAEYLSGQALPVPGGHLAGRGHRPRGGHPGPGHQLARGHRAARGGGHAGGVRPLLELVPEDLLRRSPPAARTRSRARC